MSKANGYRATEWQPAEMGEITFKLWRVAPDGLIEEATVLCERDGSEWRMTGIRLYDPLGVETLTGRRVRKINIPLYAAPLNGFPADAEDEIMRPLLKEIGCP